MGQAEGLNLTVTENTKPPMSQRSKVIFADDLTGAASTAALLHQQGAKARLVDFGTLLHEMVSYRSDSQDVLIVNTRTRDLGDVKARKRISECLEHLLSVSSKLPLVGRRTDTSLRGPVLAELDLLAETLKPRYGLFSPAYPAAGRISRGGIHFIEGEAVANLCEFLQPLPHAKRVHVGLPRVTSQGTWWAPDYQLPGDARQIARRAQPLADQLLVVDSGMVFAEMFGSPAKRILVVQGSSSPQTLRQLDNLKQARYEDVTVLYTPLGGPVDANVERLIGKAVRELQSGDVSGIIVGGGLTAEALVEVLNISEIEPFASPEPLVAASRVMGGLYQDLLLITKGGDVGGLDSIRRLVEFVRMLGG